MCPKIWLGGLLIFCSLTSEGRKIVGQVVDSETHKPIRSANVHIAGTEQRVITNHLGFFSLDVEEHHNELIISSIGFQLSKTEIPAASNFKILLIKSYIELPEFDLGFYQKIGSPANPDTLKETSVNPTEQEAHYPGGWLHFYNDLGELLKIDSLAKVIPDSLTNIKFTINRDGKISDIIAINLSKDHSDKIALACSGLKIWTPAMQNNLAVSQYFILPLTWSKHIFSVVDESAEPASGMAAFYRFIGNNLNYPAKARRLGIQGRVFIEFTVNQDGSFSNVSVIKGIGGGCDEEALRVFSLALNWIPGKQKGVPVKQKMVIPIIFKIGDGPMLSNDNPPFLNRGVFYDFAFNTIKYPAEARRMGVEGWVFVEIHIVQNTGELIGIKLLRDIGAGCGAEAVRVLGNVSPQMILSLKPEKDFLIVPFAFGLGRVPKAKEGIAIKENQSLLEPIEVVAIGIEREKLVRGYNQTPGVTISMNPVSRPTEKSFDDIKLRATSINLEWKNIKVIPKSIENFKSVNTISLAYNEIDAVPDELSRLANLTSLDISKNKISNLPESFSSLKSLTNLHLAANAFTQFPKAIIDVPNLNHLDLAENQIASLPNEIGNMKNLRVLYLQKNKITIIPESIQKMSELRTINLEDNSIEIIPAEINQLSNLYSLFMASNKLKQLNSGFSELKSLAIIGFANNLFLEFPVPLTQLSKLTALDLAGNQIQSLPDDIGNLKSLQELYLQGNQITSIPESLYKLTQLKKLYLEGNSINEDDKRKLRLRLPKTEILF